MRNRPPRPGDFIQTSSQPLNTVAGGLHTRSASGYNPSNPLSAGSSSSLRVLWDGTSDLLLNNISTSGFSNFVQHTFVLWSAPVTTLHSSSTCKITRNLHQPGRHLGEGGEHHAGYRDHRWPDHLHRPGYDGHPRRHRRGRRQQLCRHLHAGPDPGHDRYRHRRHSELDVHGERQRPAVPAAGRDTPRPTRCRSTTTTAGSRRRT